MKTAAVSFAALALLAGCGEEKKPAPSAPPSAPAAVPAAKSAYPLTTCVVSDEKLGGMGDPVIYDHAGTEVRFCCEKCVDTFKKDPAKYLAKLDAAKKAK